LFNESDILDIAVAYIATITKHKAFAILFEKLEIYLTIPKYEVKYFNEYRVSRNNRQIFHGHRAD